jgi:hypothetical protein
MPYDTPYYIEETGTKKTGNEWTIFRRAEGIVCTGQNFDEMVKLVDAANELALQLTGDKGR